MESTVQPSRALRELKRWKFPIENPIVRVGNQTLRPATLKQGIEKQPALSNSSEIGLGLDDLIRRGARHEAFMGYPHESLKTPFSLRSETSISLRTFLPIYVRCEC